MYEQPARDFDRWVVLSLRLRHGSLWLEYRDETGAQRSGPPEPPGSDLLQWRTVAVASASALIPPGFAPSDVAALGDLSRRFAVLFVPSDLESLLRSGFTDLTESRHHWTPEPVPHSETVPWLLPVFISPPPGMEAGPWEHVVEATLFQQPDLRNRCVLLRLARPTWKLPRPLDLPLTIFDASDPAADWLSSIRSRHWYADNPEVREVGVRLEPDPKRPLDRGRARSTRAHILLERTSRPASRLMAHRDPQRRRGEQRLIVAFNDSPLDEGLSGYLGTLPDGTSLLIHQAYPQLLDTGIEATIMEMVYTLVHDFALHEAVWILRRARPGLYFLLASDPFANQALRLSRVMRQIVDDTLALTLPSAGSDASGALEHARSDIGQLAFDFSRESRGLTDMSRLLAGSIRQARQASRSMAQAQPALETETRERLARTQARRADLALEEYNEFGVLTPMDEWARKKPLRAGWRYRLRVHIGQQDKKFSAVEGDVPTIDPLLPHVSPEQAYEIDVVVFEKSFGLLSRGVQTLQLPPFGGSKPVYFELRAPSEPGTADLRVALYYANNLLQSFVLEAEIAAAPISLQLSETAQVRVRLTSSGTMRFGNLGELGARALSLALNDDVRGGTHTLMVKKGKLRESIALTEKQIEEHMREFRDLLGKAINAVGASAERLFPVHAPQSPERDRQFEAYLREFARIGHKIWKRLLERRGANTDALLALQRGGGETVQFVRQGKLLPFPWQTIYDYPLPEGDGFQNAPVCLADTPVVRAPGRREKGCPHHPGQDVVCVEGFWSVRHRVEQLTEDRNEVAPLAVPGQGSFSPQDRITRIEVPPGNPLVCLGIGNDDLPARGLEEQLRQKLGKDDLRVLTDAEDPLEDILWDVACRPGLLIVLSHLQPADEKNNLPARVHAAVSKPPRPPNVLSETGLLQQKLHLKEWTVPPRPFVLLMACESAQVQLKDLTNLVDTFFGVGAAAVAGTESDVISDLAADFAAHVTIGLTTGSQSLGDLLRAYTAGMLKGHNPLPFAFTVFGSAELTVGRIQA